MADAPAKPRRHVRNAAAVLLAGTMLSGLEGLRHSVYLDVVKVPTFCVGETKNPKWGHYYSTQECLDILDGRLQEFAAGVEGCVKVDLPPKREAAFISFAYNLGVPTFCRSKIVTRINMGDVRGACDAMLPYDHAGGVRFPGLTRRREYERAQCLAP